MGGLAAMGLHGFVVPATIPPSLYLQLSWQVYTAFYLFVIVIVWFLGFQIRCVSRVGNLGSPQRRHVQL